MKALVKKERSGYALVTVLSIMAILAFTFTMLLKNSSQSVHMGNILGNRTRATAYAEAGLEYAYAILRDDYTKRTDLSNFLESNESSVVSNSVQTTYGEGSYTLKLTSIGNQYVLINSIGICGDSTVEVEAVCEDSNAITDDNGGGSSLSGFDFDVFGGGGSQDHRIGGGTWASVSGSTAGMHFNASLNNNGNTAITGNISTTGAVSDPDRFPARLL